MVKVPSSTGSTVLGDLLSGDPDRNGTATDDHSDASEAPEAAPEAPTAAAEPNDAQAALPGRQRRSGSRKAAKVPAPSPSSEPDDEAYVPPPPPNTYGGAGHEIPGHLARSAQLSGLAYARADRVRNARWVEWARDVRRMRDAGVSEQAIERLAASLKAPLPDR